MHDKRAGNHAQLNHLKRCQLSQRLLGAFGNNLRAPPQDTVPTNGSPSVQTQESPLDKRIEFLRVKGLTQEEIDAALAQVGITRVDAPIASSSTSSTAEEFFSVPVTTQPQPVMHQYHNTVPAYNYAFDARRLPPPQREKDWKDWFVSWFTCKLKGTKRADR